jgi:hypothetical protein
MVKEKRNGSVMFVRMRAGRHTEQKTPEKKKTHGQQILGHTLDTL